MARNFFSELSYAKPQSQFVGGVDFSNGLNKLDDIYSKVDDRPVSSTNSLRWDSDKAAIVDKGYEKEVDDLIASNTDPHQILGKVKQNAKRRVSDLNNSNTLPGALNKSVNERSAAIKKYDDLSDKEFDKTYANLQLQKKDRQAEKSGGTRMSDDGLGYHTYGEAPDIAAKVDVNEKYNKLGEGFKADEFGTEGSFRASSDGLYRVRNGKTTERVDEKDVLSVVGNGLARDNELVSSLRQDAEKDVFRTLLQRGVPRESALDALNEGKLPIGDSTIDVQALINKEVNSKINKAAQDAAVKFGYRRDKFTSDENKAAGADEKAMQDGIPQQSLFTQVRENSNFSKLPNLTIDDVNGINKEYPLDILKKRGITTETQGSKNGTTRKFFKDGKEINQSEYQKYYNEAEAFEKAKTPEQKLEIAGKDNQVLNKIVSNLKTEGNFNAKDAIERYNSKLNSLKTTKDNVLVTSPEATNDLKGRIFGNKGEGFANVVNMNVIDEKGNKLPWNIFVKEQNGKGNYIFSGKDVGNMSPDEVDTFRSGIGVNGLLSPNSDGQVSFSYKGKTYRLSGTNEREEVAKPIRRAFDVVDKDIDQQGNGTKLSKPVTINSEIGTYTFNEEPINFTKALAGKTVIGYAVGKDIWDKNQHLGRTGYIILAAPIPGTQYTTGDVMSTDDLLQLQISTDYTNNQFQTQGQNKRGVVDGKYKIGE